MNIVINGKNLQKRIINGQEVEKVIRNGVQIRPESTPPTPTEDYLCFTTRSSNAQIRLWKSGNPDTVSFEISSDKIYWSDYTLGDYINLPNEGDKVYFRNKSETVTRLSYNRSNYYYFQTYGYSIEASGDVNYLLCKNSTLNLSNAGDYCFSGLFSNCLYLRTAPKLPATTLTGSCYERMFYHTSLTTAPQLPATNLASYCYFYMFYDCTSLTTAPQLPATNLANHCYTGIFSGCTSLTTVPQLPATNLAESCYEYMFENCTSLTTVPQLPATNLANYCYYGMFYGCTSLIALPTLPATTLYNDCYDSMFYGCSSIKLSTTQTGEYQTPYRIPTSGTGTEGWDALLDMFENTGGTFTGTPSINTTYYTSNQVI